MIAEIIYGIPVLLAMYHVPCLSRALKFAITKNVITVPGTIHLRESAKIVRGSTRTLRRTMCKYYVEGLKENDTLIISNGIIRSNVRHYGKGSTINTVAFVKDQLFIINGIHYIGPLNGPQRFSTYFKDNVNTDILWLLLEFVVIMFCIWYTI